MIEPLRYHNETATTFEIERPAFCVSCQSLKSMEKNPNIAVVFCCDCPSSFVSGNKASGAFGKGAFLCKMCENDKHKHGSSQDHKRQILVVGPAVRKRIVVRGDGMNFPMVLDKVEIKMRAKIYHNGRRVHRERTKEIPFVVGMSGKSIHVQILGARNLRCADLHGSADPFVVYSFCGKPLHNTRVRHRTLNPRWDNETIVVPMDENLALPRDCTASQKDVFRLEVFDKDFLSQNEFLGQVEMHRSKLMKLAIVAKNQPIRIPLTSREFGGLLHVQLAMTSNKVHVKICAAEDLDKRDLSSLNNAYVKVFLGDPNNTLLGMTPIIKNAINPIWNQHNVFTVPMDQFLSAEAYMAAQIHFYRATHGLAMQMPMSNSPMMSPIASPLAGSRRRPNFVLSAPTLTADGGGGNGTGAVAGGDHTFDAFNLLPDFLGLIRLEVHDAGSGLVAIPLLGRRSEILGRAALHIDSIRRHLPKLPPAIFIQNDSPSAGSPSNFQNNNNNNSSLPSSPATNDLAQLLRRTRHHRRFSLAQNPTVYAMQRTMSTSWQQLFAPNASTINVHSANGSIWSGGGGGGKEDDGFGDASLDSAGIEKDEYGFPEGEEDEEEEQAEDGEEEEGGVGVRADETAGNNRDEGDVEAPVKRLRRKVKQLSSVMDVDVESRLPISNSSNNNNNNENNEAEVSGRSHNSSDRGSKNNDDGDDDGEEGEEEEEEEEEDESGSNSEEGIASSSPAAMVKQASQKMFSAASRSLSRFLMTKPSDTDLGPRTSSALSTSLTLSPPVSRGNFLSTLSQRMMMSSPSMRKPISTTTAFEEEPIVFGPVLRLQLMRQSRLQLDETQSLDQEMEEDLGFIVVRLLVASRGAVLQGLDTAVQRMTVGETAHVKCRFDLAYGSYCLSAHIPPRANVVFTVTLLSLNGRGRGWSAIAQRMVIRLHRVVSWMLSQSVGTLCSWVFKFLTGCFAAIWTFVSVHLGLTKEKSKKELAAERRKKRRRRQLRRRQLLGADGAENSAILDDSEVDTNDEDSLSDEDADSEDGLGYGDDGEDDAEDGYDPAGWADGLDEAQRAMSGGDDEDRLHRHRSLTTKVKPPRPRTIKPDKYMQKHLSKTVRAGGSLLFNYQVLQHESVGERRNKQLAKARLAQMSGNSPNTPDSVAPKLARSETSKLRLLRDLAHEESPEDGEEEEEEEIDEGGEEGEDGYEEDERDEKEGN